MIHFLSRRRVAGLTKLGLLGALALLPLANVVAIAPRDTINVMIVGDSISQGRQGDYTWRYRIWQWFTDNEIAVNFVGPYAGTRPPSPAEPPSPPLLYGQSAPDSPPLTNAGYAADVDSGFLSNDFHFAVWGRQLAQDVGLIAGMVSDYQPDYLLVELGFNDMGWFITDAAGTLANMETFIANARSAKSDLKFAIANVPMRTFIGGRDDLITKTDSYNAMLLESIPSWSTSQSPIYLVDFRDNYSCEPEGGCPAGSDGLHPDALGEFQIAIAFADTLHYGYGLGKNSLFIPGTFPVRPCDTPANINAVPSVAGVTVTWDPVYGAYGYIVQSAFEGGDWSTWNTTAPRYDTTWTEAGITWQYMVQAICGNVLSDWTITVSATANPTVAPGPSNIWVTPTANGIDLTWDAVEGYNVDLYGVLYWDTSIVGSYVTEYGFTGTSASITGLPVGDSFVIAVQTWETVDGVPYAGLPASAKGAVIGGEPLPPTNFQVVTVKEGATVQMTWDASEYAYGYRIWTRNLLNSTDVLTPGSLYTTETCYGATYLFPGAWNYEFCVTAFNGNYESVLSGCIVAPEEITTVSDCPAPPATSGAATGPTVTWSSPSIITATPAPSIHPYTVTDPAGDILVCPTPTQAYVPPYTITECAVPLTTIYTAPPATTASPTPTNSWLMFETQDNYFNPMDNPYPPSMIQVVNNKPDCNDIEAAAEWFLNIMGDADELSVGGAVCQGCDWGFQDSEWIITSLQFLDPLKTDASGMDPFSSSSNRPQVDRIISILPVDDNYLNYSVTWVSYDGSQSGTSGTCTRTNNNGQSVGCTVPAGEYKQDGGEIFTCVTDFTLYKGTN